MPAISELPAHALLEAYRARSLSPVEVVEASLARAEELAHLNAFWSLQPERALEEAHRAERAWRRGAARPLLGVPVAIKDLFDTAGIDTTYGSKLFRGHVPTADAPAVAALRRAGAIMLGKTATHEFAYGITTRNPHFGPTRNPHAPDRIPGGSSGGSGAAVGGGICPIALGSDTSGSIRVPAAFCGCVGIRPTQGAVSTMGAMALAPSLDTVGPLARDAADAALALDVLVRGAPSIARLAPAALPGRQLRVGVIETDWPVALAPAVAAGVETARSALAEAGCAVSTVEFPGFGMTNAWYVQVLFPEVLRVHERAGLWPARRADYGEDVRARIEASMAVSFAEYVDALEARRVLTELMAAALRSVDVLLTPPSAVTAVPIEDSDAPLHLGTRHPVRDLVLPFCTPQSLTGVPVVSVPVGADDDGLPTAVHLTAARGDDRRLLRVAGLLERALA